MRISTILLAFIALLSGLSGHAQQDAIYSQYMFNPFAINPAYAGSRASLSGVLLSRSQWLGIDGAPTTQTFALHAPIQNRTMALGLNIVNDQIGPTRNTGAFGTYAYHLRFPTGKLSLALRGGVYSSRLDRNQLTYQDPADRFNQMGTVTTTVPSFDFGAYYYTDRFYAGMALTHLDQASLNYFDEDSVSAGLDNGGSGSYLSRHLMLSSGYAFKVSDDVVFKPSFLLKYVQGAPVNVDVNASFLFKKVFWLGASVRTGSGVVLITEYNITDFLRLGYSYDIVTNDLQQYNRGTHEIFVGFDFAVGKDKTVSPRYL